MDPIKTLSSAGQFAANSYSDKFSIVSDCRGELIAIFSGDNALAMANALVALPGVLAAMDAVDEVLDRLADAAHADP